MSQIMYNYLAMMAQVPGQGRLCGHAAELGGRDASEQPCCPVKPGRVIPDHVSGPADSSGTRPLEDLVRAYQSMSGNSMSQHHGDVGQMGPKPPWRLAQWRAGVGDQPG